MPPTAPARSGPHRPVRRAVPTAAQLRAEVRPLLWLAVPVVLGELAWMMMGVVDTMMVGRVSAEHLGALSIGRVVFMTIAVFGVGLLLGLDTLVSRSFGAGNLADCRHSLAQGTWLAVLLTLPLTLLYRAGFPLLVWVGVEPSVLDETWGYMGALTWAMLPVLLYTAFRRYLQAVNLVRPVMAALISANLVNVALNWVLIFGHLGAPALGVTGAGWATVASMVYLALFLWVVIRWSRRERPGRRGASRRVNLRPDVSRLKELLALGLPASLQISLEVAVFAIAGVLAGRFGAVPLSAHHVALTAASVTYMVPLGISSAAAVRVGHGLGRDRPTEAASAGWAAVAVAGLFMLLPAAAFTLVPARVGGLFTDEIAVIATAVPLFYCAAAFQFFDGVCVSAIGALRGAGDTRGPMIWTVVGYWLCALPAAYLLAFAAGLGVLGLWIGLCIGLIVVASLVLPQWARATRRLA